ncbi:MAG: M4 family metallopeptidase [Anaerolineaceae bacterium]|nr:M4 family metallopeptidase [Anaerolineaceae bacterium]
MKKAVQLLSALMLMMFLFGTAAAQFDLSGGNSEPSLLDKLKVRDEDLVAVQQNGKVTWISGDLTDTVVTDADSAWKALEELVPALGADENTEYKPDIILEDDSGFTYYTYMQFYNSISIIDSVVKLIVDPEGHVAGIVGKVTPIEPEDYDFENTIDEGTALQIAMDTVKKEDPDHTYTFMEDMDTAFLSISVDGIEENEAGVSNKAFYIFYSNNPDASNEKHDMPILAHYVTMNGIYAGSQPCTYTGDKTAMSGSDAESVFAGMTADTWTGTVTDRNGDTREITVPVMKDANGVTWLGDLERKIVIAECADLMQDKPVKESILNSERNESWPNKVLMAYENYIKVWDFYNELGWPGPDGIGSPMVIMNNYVDRDLNPVDNAVYMGFQEGFHLFATSELNNYCEALDVIGHEYTHAVTSTSMTMNLYLNEYGAINEAMSDIMGNIIEYSLEATDDTDWLLGENSGTVVRSMSNPNAYQQPVFVGDRYWVPKAGGYNQAMDYGGVHTNSGLLNSVAYKLYNEGMTIDELRHLFSGVICGLTPSTGNAEMGELLLFSAKISDLDNFSELIKKVCDEIGFGINANMLLRVPEGCGRLVMYLPETEKLDRDKAQLTVINMQEALFNILFSGFMDTEEVEELTQEQQATMLILAILQSAKMTWADYETGLIVMTLPEGDYTLMFMQDANEANASMAAWNGQQWVSMSDESSGFGEVMVHVQAGCETWISNAGLDDAMDELPVSEEAKK